MIFEFVKNAVETVEALREKVFPAGTIIDEDGLPCAVYSLGPRTAECDLRGVVHHYNDVVDVDLLGSSYDELYSIAQEVTDAFRSKANQATEFGEYVFGVAVTVPERDAADLELGLMRRVLRVSIDWCELPD